MSLGSDSLEERFLATPTKTPVDGILQDSATKKKIGVPDTFHEILVVS